MKRQTLIKHITKAITTTTPHKEGQLYFISDVQTALFDLSAKIRAEIEAEKRAKNPPVAWN
jgi:hypothetical protein